MENWRNTLLALTNDVEQHFDRMKTRFTLRMQEERSIQLLIYRSFGTYKSVRIQGRALFHPGDLNAQDNDSIWRNLLNAYRRYESDEIPNLPLRVKIGENALDVVTDEEGYFDATIALRKPLSARIAWHKVQVFITDGPETGISAAGQVLITPANASLGIISDIDDTVLQTGAESLLTMARLTFLRNARTRLPFEGAAAFYNALHQGVDQREANPLFFVSSSPWNLYDFLIDFLEFHQFPKAPILLRDLGIDANKFIGEKHSVHKAERIRRILSTYPDLPFVLIGDNGQEDGEIYRSIIHEFPGRIAAVYIRDVSLEKEKKGLIDSIGIEMEERGVPFLRVADSYAAAEHAESLGLIASSDLERVKTAMMQRINPLMMGPGNRS